MHHFHFICNDCLFSSSTVFPVHSLSCRYLRRLSHICPPSLWRHRGQKCVLALRELVVVELSARRRSCQSFPSEVEGKTLIKRGTHTDQYQSDRDFSFSAAEYRAFHPLSLFDMEWEEVSPNRTSGKIKHDGSTPCCEVDRSHLSAEPVLLRCGGKERYVTEPRRRGSGRNRVATVTDHRVEIRART